MMMKKKKKRDGDERNEFLLSWCEFGFSFAGEGGNTCKAIGHLPRSEKQKSILDENVQHALQQDRDRTPH